MSTEELFCDGYTVIEKLIDDETCDNLKEYLDKKYHEYKRNGELPYNYLKGHDQIHLPRNVEDLPLNYIFNKKIHSIIEKVFAKNYYMYSYTCNANSADKHQPYHMDSSHFHPLETIKKFGSPGPPVQIIVNLYLEDTDENNASFEIVPGSHLFTDFEINEDGIIDEKFITKTRRCNLKKGSVIIRDKRTWHRGTLNKSNKVRYMAGIGYSANYYKVGNLVFDKKCEDEFYDAPFSVWNIEFT